MEVVDIATFVSGETLLEKDFIEAVNAFDWGSLDGKKVLVRGCGDMIIPTWAYMMITARLSEHAASIRYGNEHSSIVVFRKPKTTLSPD